MLPTDIKDNAPRENSRIYAAQFRFHPTCDPQTSRITLRGKISGGKSVCYNENAPQPKSIPAYKDDKAPSKRTIGHEPDNTRGGETKKANLKEKQRPFATAFGKNSGGVHV